MPPLEFSAVVLAAGHSTRMGSDKALLEFAGVALWRRQHAMLRQAGAAEIFISAREEQLWAQGEHVVRDAVAGGGPLGGLVAALERAAHGHLAVLAVDLPNMEAKWFQSLLAECSAGVGAVARRTGNGDFFEPLAAVYPREILGLARGIFSTTLVGRSRGRVTHAGAPVARGRIRDAGELERACPVTFDRPDFVEWARGCRLC